MKIYRNHHCVKTHRSWKTAAKCIWPRSYWIHGEGPFAVIAYCDVLTITLWQDPDEARAAKVFIDSFGCGGKCSKSHDIVELAESTRA